MSILQKNLLSFESRVQWVRFKGGPTLFDSAINDIVLFWLYLSDKVLFLFGW